MKARALRILNVWIKFINCSTIREVMHEIEVKFLDIRRRDIEGNLIRMGARKTFDGSILSENFDFPDRRISKGGSSLRLRLKSEQGRTFAELTIKTHLSKKRAKISDETEFVVDYSRARKALFLLGLRPVVKTQKRRTSYSLGDAHFEFDKVAGIPVFLEVEAGSLKELRASAEKVGLTMSQAKPWGFRDVLRHYKKL